MKEKDKFLREGCISVMLNHGLVEPDPDTHEKSRVMMSFSADESGTQKKHQSLYLQRFEAYSCISLVI